MTDIDLNRAVAKKLGRKFCACGDKEHTEYVPSNHSPRNYVNSIEAVWEIVEHMQEQFTLQRLQDCKQWICTMNSQGENGVVSGTAPRAICLAFLKLP